MIHLAAHRGRFPNDRLAQIRRLRRRGIHDDGQRRLERMGEVAGVAPRFLGLRLAVGEQLVDFFGQRPDLRREIRADAGLLARADRGHLAPNAPQRPQAVDGLQRGEDQQSQPQRPEAPDQGLAKPVDLVVDRLARLGDLVAPTDPGAGQGDVALGDAQRLVVPSRRKFVAVVEMGLDVVVVAVDLQSAIPERP